MVKLMSDHATQNKNHNNFICKVSEIWHVTTDLFYRGADKSLARPGTKKATATKLKLLQATQKQFRRLSVQSCLRGSNDHCVGRKMATFQLFFFSRVWLRTNQHPCIMESVRLKRQPAVSSLPPNTAVDLSCIFAPKNLNTLIRDTS